MKKCVLENWMGKKLYFCREVLWAGTKKGISMNDSTAEVRIWLHIICSWVSPCMHMTVVPYLRVQMIFYILYNILLNVCQFMISDIKYFKIHSGTHLLFPYLITELCKRVRVKVYPVDTWVCPKTPIYPLKI